MSPKILHLIHYVKRNLEILYQLRGDGIPIIVRTKTIVPY